MKTKKITTTAIFIALTTFFTIVIKIPVSPAMGYVNLGDFIILLATLAFGMTTGVLSAALGSSLADLLLGYGAFAPFTFVVKGLMALCMGLFLKKSQTKTSILVSGVLAELVMIIGYFFTSWILYGFNMGLTTLLPNAIQAIVNYIVFALLWKKFIKITKSNTIAA